MSNETTMQRMARCTGNWGDDQLEITWGLKAARVQITDPKGKESDIILDRELAMSMFTWLSEQMMNH